MNPVELRDVFRVHRTAQGDAAALQGLWLSVREGELLYVLGPSGAGKSTLLRVIAGLEPPSAGAVSVLGLDIGRLPARGRAAWRREMIGFLGERSDRSLPSALPVAECVALPLRLRGEGRRERLMRVEALLEAVSLRDRADAPPAELSGGERQRVALCMALAHRPRVLLADEPTGELDADTAVGVRRLLADLVRAEQATAVVVTHDPSAAGDADRTVRVRDGRVVEERDALIVDRSGWIRLPPELLAEAGIGHRATVRHTDDGLIVSPAPGSAAAGNSATGAEDQGEPTAWPPVTLEIRGLRRGFGAREVISGLSARFAAGALTVVTGRSGSGKTTLLRLLAGLDRPEAGSVTLDGTPLPGGAERRAAARRQRIGYLPQESDPIPFLSAAENVELALALAGRPRGQTRRAAATALTRLGLADRASQHLSRLSAGERQRVALARALACARGLLILDEPTSRLDEAMTATVVELLARTAAQEGQTIVCASHDPLVIAGADATLRPWG